MSESWAVTYRTDIELTAQSLRFRITSLTPDPIVSGFAMATVGRATSRQKIPTIKPLAMMANPTPAMAARHPTVRPITGRVDAVTIPASGTPACLMPIPVALARGGNQSMIALVEPGMTTPPPTPARNITAAASKKEPTLTMQRITRPTTTSATDINLRRPKRSQREPATISTPHDPAYMIEEKSPTSDLLSPNSGWKRGALSLIH